MATSAHRMAIMEALRINHAYQAYQLLHVAFTVAPLVAGADKFMRLLANWDTYVAPSIAHMLPVSVRAFMMAVGVIEIIAAVIVAFKPRIGAYVVAAWLAVIIINLLLSGASYDIALRDLGLLLAALALGRLSLEFGAISPAHS